MPSQKNNSAKWSVARARAQGGALYDTLLIELAAKVETLEAANEARAVEIIRLTNAAAAQASSQAQFHADTTADETDAAPTGSLVERVVDAIVDASAAYGTADEPARAAILAVTEVLRAQGFVHAADWLEEPAPDGSLVERVRQAQGCGNERDARAAIREVAAWLLEQVVSRRFDESDVVWMLKQEADK